MGLKNKIRLGFLSLALLLFFSGIISYFELSRLSHSTHSMLGASFRNMELSKTMLDAVQDQNTALLQMIVSGSRNSDSMLIVGRQKFDSSMREANVLIRDLQGFDSIYAANVAYNRIVDAYLSDSLHKNSVGWYVNIYETSYADLTTSIKNFMVSSQRRGIFLFHQPVLHLPGAENHRRAEKLPEFENPVQGERRGPG